MKDSSWNLLSLKYSKSIIGWHRLWLNTVSYFITLLFSRWWNLLSNWWPTRRWQYRLTHCRCCRFLIIIIEDHILLNLERRFPITGFRLVLISLITRLWLIVVCPKAISIGLIDKLLTRLRCRSRVWSVIWGLTSVICLKSTPNNATSEERYFWQIIIRWGEIYWFPQRTFEVHAVLLWSHSYLHLNRGTNFMLVLVLFRDLWIRLSLSYCCGLFEGRSLALLILDAFGGYWIWWTC